MKVTQFTKNVSKFHIMPLTVGNLKRDSRSKAKKQKEFLEKLIEYISVTRAAKSARIGRQMVYDWIKNAPEFKICL